MAYALVEDRGPLDELCSLVTGRTSLSSTADSLPEVTQWELVPKGQSIPFHNLDAEAKGPLHPIKQFP